MKALIRLGFFALMLVGVCAFGQSKLPACPSSGYFHNCFGTVVLNTGTKYVGEFQDGKRNGQGTYIYPDGGKYVGEFKDDMIRGQGTLYSPKGSILGQGSWDNSFIQSAPVKQASVPSVQVSNTLDPEIARLRAEADESKRKQAELEV